MVALLVLMVGSASAQDRGSPRASRGETRAPRRLQEARRGPERGSEMRRVPPAYREGSVRSTQRRSNAPLSEPRGAPPALRLQRQNAQAGREPRLQQREECQRIFSNVQQGLSSGAVGGFSEHMAQQVYVNLRGGESGYYSANQAHYVLEKYLKSRKLVNLKFSTIGESESRPYATGSAVSVQRGVREIAQVYVSLGRSGDRWIITQINIY
jgi:hypothetical protein